MITDEEIDDLQDQAATRNTEANAAVEAFLNARPGRDLALWPPMADALILAYVANRTLRRALDTRKPANAAP